MGGKQAETPFLEAGGGKKTRNVGMNKKGNQTFFGGGQALALPPLRRNAIFDEGMRIS